MYNKFIKSTWTLFLAMGLLCTMSLGVGWASQLSSTAAQQQKVVKGKVYTSTNNQPLPGVLVHVDDTDIKTITDADGAYTITINAPEDVIVFSMEGFSQVSMMVNDKTEISATLSPSDTFVGVNRDAYGRIVRTTPAPAPAPVVAQAPAAQQPEQPKQVRGVVLSGEDNQPMPGVDVLVKGSMRGTMTDAQGRFTIDPQSSDDVLVFSYSGYQSQEIAVAGQDQMDITLKPVTEDIEQVVVVAYGTAKKESLVGAQAAITSNQLAARPLTNVGNAIGGLTSGVLATTATGQPGASAGTILVRGIGSRSIASSQPLLVVDGAPYFGTLADINPQDIESITTLKDAASSAIYGSSAGNGVILVTTKQGRRNQGRSNFSFVSNQGFSTIGNVDYDKINDPVKWFEFAYHGYYNKDVFPMGKLPVDQVTNPAFEYSLQNKEEVVENAIFAYNETYNDIFDKGYYKPFKDAGYYVIDVNQPVASQTTIQAEPVAGRFNLPAYIVINPDGTYHFNPNAKFVYGKDIDWAGALIAPSYRHDYTLSGTFGADKFNGFISLGYLNDKGYFKTSSFERWTARANARYWVNRWLTVGDNFSFTQSYTKVPTNAGTNYTNNAIDWIASIAPIYPMHLYDANYNIAKDKDGNELWDYRPTRPYRGRYNPVYARNFERNAGSRQAISNRAFAEVNLWKDHLTFTTNLNTEFTNEHWFTRYNHLFGDQAPHGFMREENGNSRTLTFNQLLNFNYTFAEIHDLSILLGHENFEFSSRGIEVEARGVAIPGVDHVGNYSELSGADPSGSLYRKEGYFARANYSLMDRYIFSASYRYDGSSRFAADKRWGHFWSAGVAWLMHKESFMSGTSSWLNELKLRFSAGATGVDAPVGYYAYQNLYVTDLYYVIEGRPGLVHAQKGNPSLVWESQLSFDFAIEFAILKRLRGTIELFDKESYDLLFDRPMPPSTGFSSQDYNIGKVRNFGVEFELNYLAISNKDMQLSFFVNGSAVKNSVIELPANNKAEGIVDGFRITKEGFGLYSFYVPTYLGVDPLTGRSMYKVSDEVAVKNAAVNARPGGEPGHPVTYLDENGQRQVDYTRTYSYSKDNAEYKILGSPLPWVHGGFGSNFAFMGIDFSFLAQYRIGGWVYDGGYASLMGATNTTQAHVDNLKAWKKPGDNAEFPAIRIKESPTNSYSYIDQYIVRGHGLLLKNVTLGYTLPDRWVNKLEVRNVRIGVAAENLFVLSARKGMNPFSTATGSIGTTSLAMARTFTATLSLNF